MMIDKKTKERLILEVYHIVGRIFSGTVVFLIGKYVLNLWG